MTEFNHHINDFDPIHNEQHRREIELASEDLRLLLEARDISPSDVLLWGYNAKAPRPENGEHSLEDGRRRLHVGSLEDTRLSTYVGPGDQEQQEEAWMVNPLKYAIEGGFLEVFRRERLEALPHEKDEDGFGTMIVEATDEDMHHATALRSHINVIRDPKAIRVSESDYKLLTSNADPRSIAEAFDVELNSGIVKVEIETPEGQSRIKYINTVENDFGVSVSNVIEVGRLTTSITSEAVSLGDVGDDALHEEQGSHEQSLEKNESKNRSDEFMERIEESRRLFKNAFNAFKDEFEERMRSMEQPQFTNLTNAIDQLQYREGAKDAFINDSQTTLVDLRTYIEQDSQDFSNVLQPLVRQLAEETEAMTLEVHHSEVADNDLLGAISGLARLVEQVQSLMAQYEPMTVDVVDKISRYVDSLGSFGYDSWGAETYMSMFRQSLPQLEDAIWSRRRLIENIASEIGN
ncbi:MAG: hypothetical protein JWM00_305 [Candidatus Saccharibacteria bacterium]|nr:hypothetical protein [Candidatus Saccharibacteria bacterium]